MFGYRNYRRKGFIEARPYQEGEDLADISIAKVDVPPVIGGMIARNPDNLKDEWYINPEYFAKHYEEIP